MGLFNFIYKNGVVINSLYAQIFSGLLQSVEEKETGRTKGSGHVEGSVPPFCKGRFTSEDSNETSQSTVTTPHDIIVFDTLNALNDRMKASVDGAKFGDILKLKGDLYIIPSDIEKNSIEFLAELFFPMLDMKGLPQKARQHVKPFLKKTLISEDKGCRFLFAAEEGTFLRGFLPPEGMQECQKAVIFKYGIRAVPAEIVAVYEGEDLQRNILPDQSILGGLHMLSGMINDFYLQGLPPSAPVTPVAIFYRLNDTDDLENVL